MLYLKESMSPQQWSPLRQVLEETAATSLFGAVSGDNVSMGVVTTLFGSRENASMTVATLPLV